MLKGRAAITRHLGGLEEPAMTFDKVPHLGVGEQQGRAAPWGWGAQGHGLPGARPQGHFTWQAHGDRAVLRPGGDVNLRRDGVRLSPRMAVGLWRQGLAEAGLAPQMTRLHGAVGNWRSIPRGVTVTGTDGPGWPQMWSSPVGRVRGGPGGGGQGFLVPVDTLTGKEIPLCWYRPGVTDREQLWGKGPGVSGGGERDMGPQRVLAAMAAWAV